MHGAAHGGGEVHKLAPRNQKRGTCSTPASAMAWKRSAFSSAGLAVPSTAAAPPDPAKSP
eukprot:4348128-Pyramimonas_sp.AAC.1